MTAVLEGIFVAPMAAAAMQPRDSAELVAGRGIEGDRYASNVNQGTYSVLRVSEKRPGEREPGRQLTLLSADSVEAALARTGVAPPASLGDLRRNLVLRGVSAAELLGAVGTEIAVGAARVFVHRHCVPCKYAEKKNGCPGLMEAIWDEGGVSCEVVASGRIRVGDSVRLGCSAPRPDLVDAGKQSPGFFIQPSKRTSAHLAAHREKLAAARRQLELIDPEGVRRLEAAYGSVGLRFWPTDSATASSKSRLPPATLAVAAGAALVVVALLVRRR